MRQLLPTPVDQVEPATAYADFPVVEGRPAVRLNMIASFDGAISVDGRSGRLGGPADRRLFAALRSSADVVLVGASTVRADRYGPSPLPIAVVSRSCRLDWSMPFFTAAITRPIIITVAGVSAAERIRAAQVADLVIAGDRDVDLHRALNTLTGYGFRRVLAEGGPTLNGQLAAAGLLDELCLTLSPQLVGGTSGRIVGGVELSRPRRLALHGLYEADGYLFARLRPCPHPDGLTQAGR